MLTRHRFLGAVFLVAGTCIGAGMLALPVSTAPIGFGLSVLTMFFVWLFMCLTGLLVVEANSRLPINTGYISMAQQTLGKSGKIIAWLTFLLLLYSLLTAYLTGGGALIADTYARYMKHDVPNWLSYLPWVLIFAIIIYRGTRFSDVINRFLILGLVISFAILATIITPHVKMNLLIEKGNYRYILAALPVMFASFGYHIILPSMRDYLNANTKRLVWVVIIGSLFPLCFYIFWEFLIFGILPFHGEHGLLAILRAGGSTDSLTHALGMLTSNLWIGRLARFFVFFAIASSFIGVALGLFDLLADGLKIKKTMSGRTLLAAMTLIPPLIFALTYPKGFLLALGYAGVFVAILHGILPAAMAWSGRYRLNCPAEYQVFGGKFLLLIVLLVSLLIIFSQLGVNFNWIPVIK